MQSDLEWPAEQQIEVSQGIVPTRAQHGTVTRIGKPRELRTSLANHRTVDRQFVDLPLRAKEGPNVLSRARRTSDVCVVVEDRVSEEGKGGHNDGPRC